MELERLEVDNNEEMNDNDDECKEKADQKCKNNKAEDMCGARCKHLCFKASESRSYFDTGIT